MHALMELPLNRGVSVGRRSLGRSAGRSLTTQPRQTCRVWNSLVFKFVYPRPLKSWIAALLVSSSPPFPPALFPPGKNTPPPPSRPFPSPPGTPPRFLPASGTRLSPRSLSSKGSSLELPRFQKLSCRLRRLRRAPKPSETCQPRGRTGGRTGGVPGIRKKTLASPQKAKAHETCVG